MKASIIKLLLAIVFCLGSLQGECQKQPALLVTAEFTGAGTYHCVYGKDGSFIRLTVKNISPAVRSFFVWSCSFSTWGMSKRTVYFPARVCEQNIPREITLVPGQELVFYTFVILNNNSDKNEELAAEEKFQDKENEMRFCFVEVDKMSDLENVQGLVNREIGKTYWSQPVAIRFPDNSYKLLPPPTK